MMVSRGNQFLNLSLKASKSLAASGILRVWTVIVFGFLISSLLIFSQFPPTKAGESLAVSGSSDSFGSWRKAGLLHMVKGEG